MIIIIDYHNDNHNDNDNHTMVNYLEQNANNRLKALKSDRIMTLVSAAPVAKPDCMLDLRSTEIFQTSLKCSKKIKHFKRVSDTMKTSMLKRKLEVKSSIPKTQGV